MKRIPTSIRSGPLLVRLLHEVGFPQVEQHASPQPLLSWTGNPTGAQAEIILRRKWLDAISDDVGFTRGAAGTFEAVLSDIHSFRFDRAWFADLEARHARAAQPQGEALELVLPAAPSSPAGFSLPSLRAPALEPGTPSVARVSEEATTPDPSLDRRELAGAVAKVVQRARDRGFLRSCGIALFLMWLPLMCTAYTTRERWGGMIVFSVVFVILFGLAGGIASARAVRAGVREFEQHFPPGSLRRRDAQRRLSELAETLDPRMRSILLRIYARTGGPPAWRPPSAGD